MTPTPPAWLSRVRPALEADLPAWFAEFTPPPEPKRRSAVLLAFTDGASYDGIATPPPSPDSGPAETPAGTHPNTRGTASDSGTPSSGLGSVVLIEKATSLRSHAGQAAFPGGHLEPGDADAVAAAVREAEEEVGLDPRSVEIVDTLPPLFMHPRQNAVTPVLAWWREPHPITAVDASEVARVVVAGLDDLLDPANRFTVRAFQDYRGPGFEVDGLFVWGFTATLLDHVLDLAGLTIPWDTTRERALPPRLLQTYLR